MKRIGKSFVKSRRKTTGLRVHGKTLEKCAPSTKKAYVAKILSDDFTRSICDLSDRMANELGGQKWNMK